MQYKESLKKSLATCKFQATSQLQDDVVIVFAVKQRKA